jgi:hypothetical protein
MEIEQELTLKTDSDEATSSDSQSELDEDTVVVDDNGSVTGNQDKTWSRSQHHGILVPSILSLEFSVD